MIDEGVGIADHERLFNPFTQVGERRQGTGLGLVICKELVEAMGGTIAVTSGLGRGTTVRVELPPARAVAAEPSPTGVGVRGPAPSRGRRTRGQRPAARRRPPGQSRDPHPPARGARLRHRHRRATPRRRSASFTAQSATGSCSATCCSHRRRLRADPAACVRSRPPRPPAHPVVALTASAVRGERERCREAGMDDLVVKPATPATMAGTLRRWLPHVAWPPPSTPRSSTS